MTASVPFLIMLLLACLAQVTADIYLPSFPAIAVALNTDLNTVQLTLSTYMYGFACSQLIYGPLSDAIGRKKPLIFGMSLLVIGGVLCALTTSISMLLWSRLLQGFGAGSCTVLARAMLRDVFDAVALARKLSYLVAASVTMMTSAPMFGGYLHTLFGWRANFIAAVLLAASVLLWIIFFLPETNTNRHRKHLHWRQLLQNLRELFSNGMFCCMAITIFLCYGVVLAWLTVSPVLLQSKLGLTPIDYGWVVFLVGIIYGVGGFINGQLVARFGVPDLLRFGSYVMLLGASLLFWYAWSGQLSIWNIVLPTCVLNFGMGFVFPNCFASAFAPFRHIAGIAGSMLGFIQIMGGAVASVILSYSAEGTQQPLAITQISVAMSVVLIIFLYRRYYATRQ